MYILTEGNEIVMDNKTCKRCGRRRNPKQLSIKGKLSRNKEKNTRTKGLWRGYCEWCGTKLDKDLNGGYTCSNCDPMFSIQEERCFPYGDSIW